MDSTVNQQSCKENIANLSKTKRFRDMCPVMCRVCPPRQLDILRTKFHQKAMLKSVKNRYIFKINVQKNVV